MFYNMLYYIQNFQKVLKIKCTFNTKSKTIKEEKLFSFPIRFSFNTAIKIYRKCFFILFFIFANVLN